MSFRLFPKSFNVHWIIIFLCLAAPSVMPQAGIVWTELTSQQQLPAGVRLFQGDRSSPVLKAWYLDIDTRKNYIVKPYTTPAGREDILAFAARYNALAAVNGGYFDNTTGQIYSAVVQPDNLLAKNIAAVTRNGVSYPLTRSFWGMKDDRTMAMDWIYHMGSRPIDIYRFAEPTNNVPGTPAPTPNPVNGSAYYELVAGIGGGPRLIRNGVDKFTYTQEVFWGSGVDSVPQPRTAIGYTASGHILLMVADGRSAISAGLSLREEGQILVSLGCTDVMNLDGGGSSQMMVKNAVINSPDGGVPYRTLPAILCVVPADSLPLLAPPTYNKKIDTDDQESRLMGSGWTVSNLAGYWGTSPSMYCAAGNGDSYAEFTPRLPGTGVYRIDAWWTAASNRATDAPFIIRRKDGTDTVRMNQTLNGLKWNKVGTFTFKGDTTDKIIISNKCTAGSVIIADAIRITSADTTLSGVQPAAQQPEHYALEQNYPNPFNSGTVVSWKLEKPSSVKLVLYDMLGREVRTIVNGYYGAGAFRTNISMNSFSSGVYYYQLQAGSYSITKKMLLLR